MPSLEHRLLSCLTTPEALTEAWEKGVRLEVFEEPLYSAIFSFTIDYWRNAQMKAVPTAWVLSQEFPGFSQLDEVEEPLGYLADKLQQRYVTNQLQDMVRTAATDSVTDPVGALKMLHAAAYAASEAVAPRNLRLNMADTIQARRERYGAKEAYPQGLGVTYGLDLLDLHSGGILPGELAVVGALSKTGKTMCLLHAAAQAVRKGYHPLVFTLEMGLHECEDRLDAMFSGVSYNRLSKGHLRPEEMTRLHEAQEELASLGGIHVERPEEGDRTVISLCSRARQLGVDYLVIDQLSYMEPGRKVQTLKEHHSIIMRQLKNEISRAGMELPCLLAVQANRSSAQDGITLQSFANATEVEQVVDMALGLWRNADMRNNHCMQLDILGSRRSDIASWLLEWELSEATRIRVLREVR